MQIYKSLLFVPSFPLRQLAIADLYLEVWVWESDDVGEAGGLLMKFLEIPDEEGAIGLYLIFEGEKGLAGERVADRHLDVVLLFSETERSSLVYGVDCR